VGDSTGGGACHAWSPSGAAVGQGFFRCWRAGLGRRPAWGSDAAAARLKSSGGGAWRLSSLEGDEGRARHGVQAEGGVAAWVLQHGGGADGPNLGLARLDLGLAGPDLGLIGTAATSGR
jgi:hypothetical protein